MAGASKDGDQKSHANPSFISKFHLLNPFGVAMHLQQR